MKALANRNRLTFAAAILCSTACAHAQHVNELTPRVGEQRLNRFQYLASHNSFQRGTGGGMTLREQLDYWGMTQLELDIFWEDGAFEVQHNCADFEGEGTLASYLDDLASSEAVYRSIVFVGLQVTPEPDSADDFSCFSDMPSNWPDLLQQAFENALGAHRIYTWLDFEADNKKWPSAQELLRRDKHIILTGVNDSNFFLGKLVDNEGTETLADWEGGTRVLVNTPGFDPQTHPWTLGDRWISRDYPSGQLTCPVEPNSDWEASVAAGYTFAATNCVGDVGEGYEARILDNRIHPPIPMYVDTQAFGVQLGTWWRPYANEIGLTFAFLRVFSHEQTQGTSNIPIVIESGTFNMTSGGSTPLVIDEGFMTLDARGGPVIIQ